MAKTQILMTDDMPSHRLPIRVTCTGAEMIDWREIQSLQGDLKTIDDTAFAKLKRSLIDHGFSFPFVCWRHDDAIYSIDGVHRKTALLSLAHDYDVPDILPAVFVDARDRDHARQLILAASSQYAKIDDQGLAEFLEGLNLEYLNETVAIPGIDNLIKHIPTDDTPPGANDFNYREQFAVIVTCTDEHNQERVYNELTDAGYECKVVTV